MTVTKNPINTTNRINSIDSLRGLAAIIIVFYHARIMLWTGLRQTWNNYGLTLHPNAWLSYATLPISIGGFAVSLFFIISGYCIHRKGAKNLATNHNFEINWRIFAWRRIWRLYPVYVAVLCLTALIDAYLIANHYPDAAWDNSVFSFVMSLLSLQGLAAPTFGSNGVFWTLAIELHLYLVYPLLFYVSRCYGAVKALSVTFVVSAVYLLLDSIFGITELFPYRFPGGGPLFIPYLFTWGFGFYIAEVEFGRALLPRRFWEIAIIGGVLTLVFSQLNYPDIAKFTSTLILGGFLWWSIQKKGQQFWSNKIGKVLAQIGIFSYSLYAIHVPCLYLIKAGLESSVGISTNIIPVYFGTTVSLIFAFILFVSVEKWTLKNPFAVKKVL